LNKLKLKRKKLIDKLIICLKNIDLLKDNKASFLFTELKNQYNKDENYTINELYVKIQNLENLLSKYNCETESETIIPFSSNGGRKRRTQQRLSRRFRKRRSFRRRRH